MQNELYNAVFDQVIDKVESELSKRMAAFVALIDDDAKYTEDCEPNSPWYVPSFIHSGVLSIGSIFKKKMNGLPEDFDVLDATRTVWFRTADTTGAVVKAKAKYYEGTINGVVNVGKADDAMQTVAIVFLGPTRLSDLGVKEDTFTDELLEHLFEVAFFVAIANLTKKFIISNIGVARQKIKDVKEEAISTATSSPKVQDAVLKLLKGLKDGDTSGLKEIVDSTEDAIRDAIKTREEEIVNDKKDLVRFRKQQTKLHESISRMDEGPDKKRLLGLLDDASETIKDYEEAINCSEVMIETLKSVLSYTEDNKEQVVKDLTEDAKKTMKEKEDDNFPSIKFSFGIRKEF